MDDVVRSATSADGSRWMGVSRSVHDDSRTAGVEAATGALRGDDPKLLIAFADFETDPAALAEGIAEVAPGVPMVGCSARGEIGPDGLRDSSVVVAALGGPGLAAATASEAGITDRQRAAGAAVAERASDLPDLRYRVLMLLTDGWARSQEEILRGAYGVVGAGVPLFGGASAGMRGQETFQLHDGRAVRNGVVAATIVSDAPIGIGISHGWRKVGEAMVVTRSDKARVYTLDNEPALDRYLNRLDAPPETYHDPAAFSAWAMTRPLGVQRRSGVAAKNIARDVDFEGRSIGGGTEMVQGALIWPTEGDAESILGATATACRNAIDALDGHDPIGLLAMSCVGSRAVLGTDGAEQEAESIGKQVAPAPFAGFYTLGEICRIRGVEGFHNQSLVVLALS
jgi:hypothetical protein